MVTIYTRRAQRYNLVGHRITVTGVKAGPVSLAGKMDLENSKWDAHC
jgi:hypothetical protein